jgi:hypothetical protein
MPCLKKCRCGTNEKFFKMLNDADIDAWECEKCPEIGQVETPPKEPETQPQADVDVPPESPAMKKAREKAEKKAAKEQKPE